MSRCVRTEAGGEASPQEQQEQKVNKLLQLGRVEGTMPLVESRVEVNIAPQQNSCKEAIGRGRIKAEHEGGELATKETFS